MAAVIEGLVDLKGGSVICLPATIGAPGALGPGFANGRPVDAFIDTGCTRSVIHEELLDKLRIPLTGGKVQTTTHNGVVEQPEYMFDLGLVAPAQWGTSNAPFFRTVSNCLALPMSAPMAGCMLVLGMDVLLTLGFTLLPNGRFYVHL